MKLVSYLNSVIEADNGYVQKKLAEEDLGRINQLRDLARQAEDAKAMRKAGLYIGWTKGDFRTHELSEPLTALINAIYDYEKSVSREADVAQIDEKIMDIWAGFHALRLKTLVHCL